MLAFMLCIFAPVEAFLRNESEFWFQLHTLVPLTLFTFICISAVFFFIGNGLIQGTISFILSQIYIILPQNDVDYKRNEADYRNDVQLPERYRGN